MNKFIILVSLLFIPSFLISQKVKLKQIMYYNSENLKEEFEVLKKNRYSRHGFYKSYFDSGELHIEGQNKFNKRTGKWITYDKEGNIKRIRQFKSDKVILDQKHGIWEEKFEKGRVIKRYDYDKNIALETIIYWNIKYPAKARELGIEGTVEIKLQLDDKCNILDLHIHKSVSREIDEEALLGLRSYIKLVQKYDMDYCKKIESVIPVQFKLEG